MPGTFLDYITSGMGNVKSKPKDRVGRSKKGTSKNSNGVKGDDRSNDGSKPRDISSEMRERFADDDEFRTLKQAIQCNPEMFVLNNLMMAVQFFENYDEEIARMRQMSSSSREADLIDCLPSPKHSLIPDVLQQHIAERIYFTCVTARRNLTREMLHPTRIYVAFDNIEVTEENDTSPYSSLNGIISMQLKKSPRHAGYVLLERLNENPVKKTKSLDNLDISSNPQNRKTEIYSDNDSVYVTNSRTRDASRSEKLPSDTTDVDDSYYESDLYDSSKNYFPRPGTSREANDRTVVKSRTNENRRIDAKTTNPESIGKTRYWRSLNNSTSGSTSSGYRSGLSIDSDSDYPRTTYNTPKTSKSSCESFSTLFENEIPRKCFRTIEETRDGRVWDNRMEKLYRPNSTDYLIIQAQKSQNNRVVYLNSARFMKHFCNIFVDRLALPMGFKCDNRNVAQQTQGGAIIQKRVEAVQGTTSTRSERFEIFPCVKFQWPECAREWLDRSRGDWPNYGIVEKICKFGCTLIPEPMITDRPDIYHDLEWQIVFPAAERYLETCLTYSQIRIYIVALMLRNSFMRSGDSIFGLTVSHVRNKLFWLIEEDSKRFTLFENRCGESLVKLLQSIYQAISQDTPKLPDYFIRKKNLFHKKSFLFSTQKQLKRILENPVMYVFHAMENMRHSTKFFPRLNFKELLRILTDDEMLLANPDLAMDFGKEQFRTNVDDEDTITEKSLVNQRLANNQVVEIKDRCGKMEPARLSRLLDFFIRHFIRMAETCHSYRAQSQKMIYVEQSERLSVLLLDHSSHRMIAIEYYEKLQYLRKLLPRTKSQNSAPVTTLPDPPETPMRNSDRPMFASPMNHRYNTFDNGCDDNKTFVDIPKPGETKEYELESARNSVCVVESTNGGSWMEKSLAKATIHEEDSDTTTILSRNEFSTTDDNAKSNDKTKRVVSIVDPKDASYLTETTYI